ncbi:HlyD family efflux transporter periplasmic adaptor subunit [Leptolyngbya sp. GGD]|uniref:HlyD family efflux transporter periplasmic adaptor subunit n=1 Tax=Leptolyngbya sp. GGD TaxID=2997907 RepID=UPI00227D4179|nr:HlyD family efflux transporter periplasmic adaptor subunit [Leptolyngbya sp. GGD]MCY6493952.1 HlyD family efflux transporter periplasmic adaptor subunit [Leptolyngbya sp. GGD]
MTVSPNFEPNQSGSEANTPPAKPPQKTKLPRFEHPSVLQQSNFWSRAILWTFIGGLGLGLVWACTAKIEEAIPAQGKLEPQGAVKEVQIPVNGVVKTILVKDGQRVKQGEVLLTIDPTTPKAQLESLQKVRTTLLQENAFYRSQLAGTGGATTTIVIPPQFLSLTRSRAALLADTVLIRAQLDGSGGEALTATQQERLQSNQAELSTRATAAQLAGDQLDRQLAQTGVKLESARRTLALNQKILADVEPLARDGAISKIQLLKQQQEVESNQSEVAQLEQEQRRLQFGIQEAQVKVENTLAVDRKDLTRQLSENEQKIAEIDSQLTKAIVENDKKLAEIDSQMAQSKQTLQYGELRAPSDGIVFELKANVPGYVANSTEPVLKIVPEDALVAKVSITNQDIGFVREGMSVDVRIDSFPFSEFGDIKGTLSWIGSDALPPTQVQPLYTFPAKIKLDRQALGTNGRSISLQSGMSLSANIKIRKRTVMSILTDQFAKVSESLNRVR